MSARAAVRCSHTPSRVEMTQLAESLRLEHENLGPLHPLKKYSIAASICDSNTGEAEISASWGSLPSETSQMGKFKVQVEILGQNQGEKW